MNLDEFKTSWKVLDEKIAASQKITENMALSMIRDKSKSTISTIQNQLKNVAIYFCGLFILFIAILVGNPFDYTNWYEYMPAIAYSFLLVVALKMVIQEIFSIEKITLSKSNLRESLQQIIDLHQSYKVVMKKVWKISMVIGFLLGISLMVRNFGNYGFIKSAILVVGNALLVSLLYASAKMIFRQIPDKNLDELRSTLQELGAD